VRPTARGVEILDGWNGFGMRSTESHTVRYASAPADGIVGFPNLHETARGWRAGAGPAYASRMLRTKTYVTQEATKLCAELFALSGGRHYTRGGQLARTLAASFAGTALRPPLALALDTLVQQFSAD
jgi:alkylation response protein AidB-like acyl-CoA dehydrogenase